MGGAVTLLEWRLLAKLTQQQVARLLRRSRPYVTQLEMGDREPGWDTVLALEDASSGAVRADDWARQIRARRDGVDNVSR